MPVLAQADKPLVAVMDFSLSGISEAEGRVFLDFLSNSIRETGKYRLIEKAERDSLLEEIKFSLSGCADEKCQLEAGRLLSANFMFLGSIGNVGDRYILNIKLVDVLSGEALATASDVYGSLNNMVDNSRKLVFEMLGKGLGPVVSEIPHTYQTKPDLSMDETVWGKGLISHTPGDILHRDKYFYKGNTYKLSFLRGLYPMVKDIRENTPDMSIEYRVMLDKYLRNILLYDTCVILGGAAAVSGYVAFIIGINSNPENEAASIIGIAGFLGGIGLSVFGGIQSIQPPKEIISYYNLNYSEN